MWKTEHLQRRKGEKAIKGFYSKSILSLGIEGDRLQAVRFLYALLRLAAVFSIIALWWPEGILGKKQSQ